MSPVTSTAPLHIACPPPRRPFPFIFSIAVGAMLASQLRAGAERGSWLGWWMLLLMGVGAATLVYRNLFVRDRLSLYRGEVTIDGDHALDAASVRAVRVLPPPSPYSAEGKWASLGLAPGRIEIRTVDCCYRFGSGLSERGLKETVDRIADYCGLSTV